MKPGASLRPLFLVVALVLTACRQTVVLDQSPDGDGSSQDAGANGGGGNSGTEGGRWLDGGWMPYDAHFEGWHLCGSGQVLPLNPRYPDVIVTVDRSAAMQAPFDNSTRLAAVQDELRKLIMQYQMVIKFGYEEFPSSTDACTALQGCCAPLPIPPGRNSLVRLDKALRACAGGTNCTSTQRPTADALKQVLDLYSRFDMTAHDRYVVLITGGEPSCAADSSAAFSCSSAEEKIRALQNLGNVRTFVVGVGMDVNTSDCLNNLAISGGEGRSAGTRNYDFAGTLAELHDTLWRIGHDIAEDACQLDVPTPPSEPNNATLLLNNMSVNKDPVNGWDFDSGNTSTITLHGTACTTLLNAPNADLELLSDCMPFHP